MAEVDLSLLDLGVKAAITNIPEECINECNLAYSHIYFDSSLDWRDLARRLRCGHLDGWTGH